MLKLTVLVLSIIASMAHAAETCSRIAVINYQEVLVDVSNNNKGEGLRYYLAKDPVSKQLLDEYQANNRSTWKSASLSTLGSVMILGGILRSNEGENETLTGRNALLFGGMTLIAVSYLISKTHQYKNEFILQRSVEEYNKRNTPRIFFSPTDPKNGLGMGVGVGQEF